MSENTNNDNEKSNSIEIFTTRVISRIPINESNKSASKPSITALIKSSLSLFLFPQENGPSIAENNHLNTSSPSLGHHLSDLMK